MYPLLELESMCMYWAAVVVAFKARVPKGTEVAVVVAVVVRPAMEVPPLTGLMVKFKVGATVADTATDSMVATLPWVLLMRLLPLSSSSISKDQVSAVPDTAVLVGFSRKWMLPMVMVALVPDAMVPVNGKVKIRLPLEVDVLMPGVLVEKPATVKSVVVLMPLNTNPVLDGVVVLGVVEPANVRTNLPPVTATLVLKTMVWVEVISR